MKRLLPFYAGLFLLMLSLAGCVGESVSITGMWERQIDEHVIHIRFEADGTFALQVGEQSRSIEGEYQTQRDVVVIRDDDCKDVEGKYRVVQDEGSISFTELNDTCEGRVDVIGGEWKRVLNQ